MSSNINTKTNIQVHLYTTFTANNIIGTICNSRHNTIVSSCSGQLDFTGSTKSCLVAVEAVAIKLASELRNRFLTDKIHILWIHLKGGSPFRKNFLKRLLSCTLPVQQIFFQHTIIRAFNGCKLPKKRRK